MDGWSKQQPHKGNMQITGQH